jgi:hypothetical protein
VAYTFKYGDRPLEGITIQRAVGRGGFGEVYYAVADSGKQMALKYLRENPEVELRGIDHVMNLKSPHLISIYDVRRSPQNDPFVLMEYVSGPSLRELMIAEPAGLGPQKAAYFIKGICQGLSYLHERGIVHRDLKPGNIFYDDGYVKIGDYGLSKHISMSKHSGQTVSVGTVHYMAPEIGSGSYSKAIDIYALGVILYEMLTGRLPFTGSSMGEILMRHLRDHPDLTGVPAPFARVIAKALEKDPNDRYQNADEFLADLQQSVDLTAAANAFDASTLTQVPRSPQAHDDPTLTHSPVPPPPPMDVRDVPPMPERFQRRLDKLTRKIEHRAGQLEQKFGPRRGAAATPAMPAAPPTAASAPRLNRKAQFFVLAAVTIAISIALGALTDSPVHGDPPPAVIFALMTFGCVVGPLLTHLKLLQRSVTRHPMLDRLAYASLAGLFMIPGIALAAEELGDERLARIAFAPLLAILLCNWGQRIEAGRAGEVTGGAAFWPAVIGFMTMAVLNNGHYIWTATALTGVIAMLTQAAASMWPVQIEWVGRRGARKHGQHRPATPPCPSYTCTTDPHAHGHGRPATLPQATPGAAPTASPTFGDPSPAIDATPGAAPQAAPVPPAPRMAAIAPLAPRSDALRVLFGILSTLAVIGSLGAFFPLVLITHDCDDDSSGLLFATLAGIALLPFLLTKTFQRYKMPHWRGTFRMLVVSAGLTLVAGMIAILAFQNLTDDELGGAIFGLVAGSIIAIVALFVRGSDGGQRSARWASATGATAGGLVDPAQPSFAGRTANAGVSFIGKLLLLGGLVLALGQAPLAQQAAQWGDDGECVRFLAQDVPDGVTLAIMAIGCVLLAIGRRHGGGGHFFRTFVGGLCVVIAAAVAIVQGGPALEALFSRPDLSEINDPGFWVPLVAIATLLAIGGMLLLWPHQRRTRTITI